MAPCVDYSKWDLVEDVKDDAAARGTMDAEAMLQTTYQSEMAQDQPVDKLKELKIKIAVDAYEKRRPADKVMHHYWVKEAGDPEAIGEYFPTGDERNDVPVYRNQHGMILSRERQPAGPDTEEECFGWVVGSMAERRPLYGVQSEDLSVPTLGWQSFTAPEPVPILRYYTQAAAARVFKEKGNRAFRGGAWAEAEAWYGRALGCQMDPAEYAEPYGLLLSNRAEARVRLGDFAGAAEDAEGAMKFLRTLAGDEEGARALRQKTVVRWAKALQGQKMYSEAAKLLQDQRQFYPGNADMGRLLEETQLALVAESKANGPTSKAPGVATATAGATPEMLSFVAKLVSLVQQEASKGGATSDLTFPESLAMPLRKLEYVLSKASSVQGDCLLDLQTILRTGGGMRTLLQIVQAQWKSNLDGKNVDTFKLHGAGIVSSIISLACDHCPENMKLASSEAPSFFSILGGCNRKVEASVCERLVALAAGLWGECRARVIELVQPRSVVVERAAAYLSRAALAEPPAPGGGACAADSPALSAAAVGQAVGLLSGLLAQGGRVEKRALRGAAPQLAGPGGEGLLTSGRAAVRSLGELVAQGALGDPAVLSAREVRNALLAVQLLVVSGPCADAGPGGLACVARDGGAMRYADLGGWEGSEGGRHCALLLRAVSGALEHRLLLKGRELERDGFEEAFHAGGGFLALIPLIQAPACFAEPALRGLAAMSQASPENVEHLVALSAFHALIGMPCPEAKPMASHLDHTLKSSPSARKHAAKLLSRTVETRAAMELLSNTSEKCIKELVKLASSIRGDGKGSLESFHDMLHVFYSISQFRPGALCRYIPEDMMNVFVELAKGQEDSTVAQRASAIVQMLMCDVICEQMLIPIIQRSEEGADEGYDIEDELKLSSTAASRMPR